MAYRECDDCGIHFPAAEPYRICPACGESTVFKQWGHAEPNWQTRAEAIAKRLSKLQAERLYEPPHCDVPITVDDEGLLWISSHDCLRADQHAALDQVVGGVITVGPPDDDPVTGPDNNLYEVISYVDEKRAYWIKPLRVPDYVE
jgi:RNA polymerase subunit RPABC4/transcription elongation factor Spt4